jgi:hypothetical protein
MLKRLPDLHDRILSVEVSCPNAQFVSLVSDVHNSTTNIITLFIKGLADQTQQLLTEKAQRNKF